MATDTITYTPTLPWVPTSVDASYGRCLSLVYDFPDAGGMVSGRLALAQALARRLITTRGTLIDDRDYGYDLSDHLNGRLTARDLADASAQIITQFRLDDRVRDAEVSVSYLGSVLLVAALIFDGEGSFPLTLSVSDITLTILKVGP